MKNTFPQKNRSMFNLFNLLSSLTLIMFFSIPSHSQSSGDWRTTTDGAGLAFNGYGWESYDGLTWNEELVAPENCGCTIFRIYIRHENVDAGANCTSSHKDIIIENGGQLIVNDDEDGINPVSDFAENITVKDGGELLVQGDIAVAEYGTITAESGGRIVINQPTFNNGNPFFARYEDFQYGSYFIIRDWDWNAPAAQASLVHQYSQIGDSSGIGTFGYLVYEASPTADHIIIPYISFTYGILCTNDLIISDFSLSINPRIFITKEASYNRSIWIGGDLKIEHGNAGIFHVNAANDEQSVLAKNDVIIDSGAALWINYDHGYDPKSLELLIEGDLHVNGDLFSSSNHSAGENTIIEFGNATMHEITIGASAYTAISEVDFQNPVLLNSDFHVESKIYFNNEVNTASHKLILGDPSSIDNSIVVASSSCGVVGTFSRKINSIVNTTVEFPMLDSDREKRNIKINYTSPATNDGYLNVNYEESSSGSNGLPIPYNTCSCGFDVENTNQNGYWVIKPEVPTDLNDGTYNIIANATMINGILAPNENILLKRADNTMPWAEFGTHIATTGTVADLTLQQNGLSGYSEFTIGGGNDNPLPVELINFNGKRLAHNQIRLDWSTASEINNDRFEIWRKKSEEIDFKLIGEVRGNGNSTTIGHYHFLDKKASNDLSLYYLNQIDFDGQSERSEVIVVQGNNQSKSISIYPNPASQFLFIDYERDENAQLELIDVLGRVVFSNTISGLQKLSLEDIPAGTYSLIIKNNNGIIHTQIFQKN